MSRHHPAIVVRFTRIGWHFAFAGAFAMVGGAIRGFNLPLVLAGLMIGALLTQWRWGRRTIEGISIARRMPDEAFVGQPFAVRFLVSNHQRWLPAWLIRIDDAVTSLGPDPSHRQSPRFLSMPLWRETPSGTAACGVGLVAAKQTTLVAYECLAFRRGRYEFGPAVISTGAPLGLLKVKREAHLKATLCVYPRLLPLQRDWKRYLQNRSGGLATTARRSGANDGDFFGLRSWQAGDSRRWIHWRTTARIGEPAVRQFEQQRRFDMCVLVDAFATAPESRDATVPTEDLADDLEVVISAAASLMTQMSASPSNRMALAIAGSTNTAVVNSGSRLQLSAMLQLLAEAHPTAQPDLLGAIDHVFRTIGQPQDILVFSTRVMPAETETLTRLLLGRCSLRWYSTADGSIDSIVQRKPGGSSTKQEPTAATSHTLSAPATPELAAATVGPHEA